MLWQRESRCQWSYLNFVYRIKFHTLKIVDVVCCPRPRRRRRVRIRSRLFNLLLFFWSSLCCRYPYLSYTCHAVSFQFRASFCRTLAGDAFETWRARLPFYLLLGLFVNKPSFIAADKPTDHRNVARFCFTARCCRRTKMKSLANDNGRTNKKNWRCCWCYHDTATTTTTRANAAFRIAG